MLPAAADIFFFALFSRLTLDAALRLFRFFAFLRHYAPLMMPAADALIGLCFFICLFIFISLATP